MQVDRFSRTRFTAAFAVMFFFGSTFLFAADAPKSGCPTAVEDLEAAIAKGVSEEELLKQDFTRATLTKEQAAKVRDVAWQQHVARITKEREAEIKDGVLKLGKLEMPFTLTQFGTQPKEGWSLWISMHGGGGAPKEVNDQQYENQKRLYKLDEGLYLVPRAPTNSWNLWHEGHIDEMFERLIQDLIVLKQVDPNRVYIMGYSAGGDGVYQLGPRMADHWAAASMMAGHPNDAKWDNLRNIGFAVQSGALDAAYDRNKIAKRWIDKLDELQKEDPQGYVHFGKIFEGKGHWMDREDAKVLPWMAALKRNPVPEKVIWRQSPRTHDNFYWLAIPEKVTPVGGSFVVAERSGQTVEIKAAEKITELAIRFNEDMVDLEKPVKVVYKGQTLFEGLAKRTITTLIKTLEKRGDPKLMFEAEVIVKLPEEKAAEKPAEKASEKAPAEKK